uniref:Uncharacterized protein n=1 Tax=Oryza brachyantha TaxID=4533 RepID=J3L0B7_ORYBR
MEGVQGEDVVEGGGSDGAGELLEVDAAVAVGVSLLDHADVEEAADLVLGVGGAVVEELGRDEGDELGELDEAVGVGVGALDEAVQLVGAGLEAERAEERPELQLRQAAVAVAVEGAEDLPQLAQLVVAQRRVWLLLLGAAAPAGDDEGRGRLRRLACGGGGCVEVSGGGGGGWLAHRSVRVGWNESEWVVAGEGGAPRVWAGWRSLGDAQAQPEKAEIVEETPPSNIGSARLRSDMHPALHCIVLHTFATKKYKLRPVIKYLKILISSIKSGYVHASQKIHARPHPTSARVFDRRKKIKR